MSPAKKIHRGDRIDSHPARASRTYSPGRRCPYSARLSIYNPGPFCYLHAEPDRSPLHSARSL